MPVPLRLALAATALAALAGAACSRPVLDPLVWSREGAGMREVTGDDVACRRAADTIGTGPGTFIGGVPDLAVFAIQEFRRTQTYDRCMQAKGYARAR